MGLKRLPGFPSLRQQCRDAWDAKEPTPEQCLLKAYAPPPWVDWWWDENGEKKTP